MYTHIQSSSKRAGDVVSKLRERERERERERDKEFIYIYVYIYTNEAAA